jgi:D-arabinonate dehydratase/D-galactarolactone cycloisomerase
MSNEFKIKNIKAIGLEVPITNLSTPPESLPYYQELKNIVFGSYKSVIVEVEEEGGIKGFGECMTRIAPSALIDIIYEVMKPIAVGKDPLEHDLIWEEIYGVMRQRGHSKGFYIEALSGLDIAIWDLAGKLLHKPVSKLLGGKFHEKLECYASSIRFKKPEDVVTEVQKVLQEGFGKVKLKIGRGVDEDIAAVKAVRDNFGDMIKIMVDANSGYNVNSALQVGKKLEKYEVLWFEEPIPPDNIPGYAELSRTLDIPIAAGESEFTRYGFRELIERGGIKVLQPNVGRAGGFTELKKILSISSAYGIPYAPHTGSSSAVTMAAEMQLAANSPDFLIYEYMNNAWSHEQPNPLNYDLLNEKISPPVNGYLTVGDADGIGISLNKDTVKKYLI